MIKIKKGLDLPISGAPDMHVVDGPPVSRVALVGSDYQGMKPTLLVAEGDRVVLGQPVFNERRTPKSSIARRRLARLLPSIAASGGFSCPW